MTIKELIKELQEAEKNGCNHLTRANKQRTKGGNIVEVEYSENDKGETTGCVLIVE